MITPSNTETRLRRDALAILDAALRAADAGNAVRNHLAIENGKLIVGQESVPLAAFERLFLISVGKAAASMGSAVQQVLGDRLTRALVVTKSGHVTDPLARCEVIEAGHPIPDDESFRASRLIVEMLEGLTERDLVVMTVSGGASALLSAPAAPVTLADKQAATDLLLRAGADIFELNCVRKHLSLLKGGRLAALAHPATVVCLLLSDVIGDPLDVIGSGLTAPDPSTFQHALDILKRFQLEDRVPGSVRDCLHRGMAGEIRETPKPGDPLFDRVHNVVVGSNRLALQAAAGAAEALGYRKLILSSTLQGETRHVARVHAEILREVVSSGSPVGPPACILSGGETTVTVRDSGKGGRNQEFALAAAIAVAGLNDVAILSAGTDGTDGPTDAAGAFATGHTVARAVDARVSAAAHLARHDSYTFFDVLGDLVKTGPTGTNVMDIHIMLAQKS